MLGLNRYEALRYDSVSVSFSFKLLSHKLRHQITCIVLTFNHSLGSFGRVMLAKNKKSGEFFAMKRLKKADIIKLRQVDHVISENTILADIDHPYLVSSTLFSSD